MILLRPFRRLAAVIRWPFRRAAAWWTGLDPAERVLYRAVALLGIGGGMYALPLLLIVPGLLFALVFFGFSFRRAG